MTALNHTELQASAVQLLSLTGWRHLHVRKTVARGGRGGKGGWTTSTNLKGWPDLAPLWTPRQPGRFIALEVKVPPDWLKPEQEAVLAELAASGMEAVVLVERLPERPRPLPEGVGIIDLTEGLPALLKPRSKTMIEGST